MTKDGRSSVINDIRLFVGDRSNSSPYLNGQEEAVAYGRRIAWFLNGEGFSLGAFPALYVLFTSSLDPGSVRITNDGGEWWHRYVHVGVAADFPDVPNPLEVVMLGIVSALVAIRPDQFDVIKRADEIAREYRDQLRFLLRRRETSKLVVEISSNIATWPNRSKLFIAHTSKETSVYCEAEPITLLTYAGGFDLINGIRLKDAINLTEMPQRPMMSGLIKRRG